MLVAGGTGDAGLLTNAEVFDASAGPAGAWTTTANMVCGHTDHTATALTDGRVLVVGNDFSFGAGPEIFDINDTSGGAGGRGLPSTLSMHREPCTARRCLLTGGCWWRVAS